MAHNEVALELLRQRLVRECDEFNTVDAFRLLDVHAACSISKENIFRHLTEVIQINVDIETLDMLFGDS